VSVPRVSDQSGYTLVELALVVLIFSMLTVMSYLRLKPTLEHGKVNSAASILAVDLQYSQFLAARQRAPIVLILNPGTQSYLIRDRADATKIYRTRYMGSDTEYGLSSFTGTVSSIDIFPTGVTRSTATFTLAFNGYQRQVLFTKAGQIRVVPVP
jgi:prepilin-type N-terminal cleavage/methylation domain-containing protein